MNQNTKYTIFAIIALLIISFCFFYFRNNFNQNNGVTPISTTTSFGNGSLPPATVSPSSVPSVKKDPKTITVNSNNSSFRSFGSAEYNFTIQFPSYTQTRNSFSTFHEISNNWRLYAQPANQGKGVLELSIFTVDQGAYSTGKQKYPLYFTSLVRVGVSPNVKECYTADAGYTNQKVTSVVINGVTFKKFSTADAGMMKYTQAESYRTIHNNMCFALEQIKSGTTYRDEKMSAGIADSSLTNYYNEGTSIIQTFKFTK